MILSSNCWLHISMLWNLSLELAIVSGSLQNPKRLRRLPVVVLRLWEGSSLICQLKAGVNLKFAQKLSFLFSSEFAALGIQLRYGKIIFYLFSLFLPFWAISKFPLWLMVWLPWQREEHFLIFQLFMMCYSGNQAPKRAGFNERYFM